MNTKAERMCNKMWLECDKRQDEAIKLTNGQFDAQKRNSICFLISISIRQFLWMDKNPIKNVQLKQNVKQNVRGQKENNKSTFLGDSIECLAKCLHCSYLKNKAN